MPPLALAAGAAAATIGGALISAKASKKAAKTAAKGVADNTAVNNALAEKVRAENVAGVAPFRDIGLTAGNALASRLAGGPFDGGTVDSKFLEIMDPGSFDSFRESSGYDFRLGEGLNALQQQYAVGPGIDNGAVQKDIVRFGQDFASNERSKWVAEKDRFGSYSDAFRTNERAYDTDRFDTYLAGLSSLYGMGASAQNALTGVTTNFGNTVMGNNNQAAQAAANAALARGAATGQTFAAAGNALGQFAGQFMPSPYGYNSGYGYGSNPDVYVGGM